MNPTQAPNGWTDKSEHEDGELDHMFSLKGAGQRAVYIYRHDWRGETEWTAMRRTSNAIFDAYKIGTYTDLSDAVEAAESWLNG